MKKKTNKSELKDAFNRVKSSEEQAKQLFEKMTAAANSSNQHIEMSPFKKDIADLLFKMTVGASSFQHYCVDILDMFVHGKINAEQCATWIKGEHIAIESINKMVYNCLQVFDKK